jgi:hypothetical protein
MNILILSSFVIGALAISVLSLGSSYGQDVLGQAIQKQSAAARANLTSADFSALTDSLITARDGLLRNNSGSAYTAINAAGSGLFLLIQSETGSNETLFQQLTKQLQPIQNNLDNAREAMRNENTTQALRNLNNADLRLLGITQGLPSDGNTAPETEEDEG